MKRITTLSIVVCAFLSIFILVQGSFAAGSESGAGAGGMLTNTPTDLPTNTPTESPTKTPTKTPTPTPYFESGYPPECTFRVAGKTVHTVLAQIDGLCNMQGGYWHYLVPKNPASPIGVYGFTKDYDLLVHANGSSYEYEGDDYPDLSPGIGECLVEGDQMPDIILEGTTWTDLEFGYDGPEVGIYWECPIALRSATPAHYSISVTADDRGPSLFYPSGDLCVPYADDEPTTATGEVFMISLNLTMSPRMKCKERPEDQVEYIEIDYALVPENAHWIFQNEDEGAKITICEGGFSKEFPISSTSGQILWDGKWDENNKLIPPAKLDGTLDAWVENKTIPDNCEWSTTLASVTKNTKLLILCDCKGNCHYSDGIFNKDLVDVNCSNPSADLGGPDGLSGAGSTYAGVTVISMDGDDYSHRTAVFGTTGIKAAFALSEDRRVDIDGDYLYFYRAGMPEMVLEESINNSQWVSHGDYAITANLSGSDITVIYEGGSWEKYSLNGSEYYLVEAKDDEGNSVIYHYDNSTLTDVELPDGRVVHMNWSSGVLQSISTKTALTGGSEFGKKVQYSWSNKTLTVTGIDTENGNKITGIVDVEYSDDEERLDGVVEYNITTTPSPRPTIEYAYDQDGWLTSITKDGGTYSYDTNDGEPGSWTYPDGSKIKYNMTKYPTPTGTPGYTGYVKIEERFGVPQAPETPTPYAKSLSYFDSQGMLQQMDVGAVDSHRSTLYEYVYEVDTTATRKTKFNINRVINNLDDYTKYTYDSEGLTTKVEQYEEDGETDILLTVSENEYDSEDRLVRNFIEDDSEVVLAESKRGYIPTTTPNAGLLAWSEDGEGRRTEYEYDADYGFMTGVSVVSSTRTPYAKTQYDYDTNTGRRIKVLSPESKVTRYQYRTGGNLEKVYQYGAMPSNTSTPSPTAFAVTEYEYDQNGYGSNLTKVIDAEGNWTTYEYYDDGRIKHEVLWDCSGTPTPTLTSYYEYEATGMKRLKSVKDFAGQAVEYEYDDTGRLGKKSWFNASPTPTAEIVLEYSYTDFGEVDYMDVSCDAGCGDRVDYTYDGLGRLTEKDDNGSDVDKVVYHYDAASRQTGFDYVRGWDYGANPTATPTYFQREWVYDRASRVVAVQDKNATQTPIATYSYNKASQRTQADFENDTKTTWQYDNITGEIDKIAHYDDTDEVFASIEYSYNLDGLRTSAALETGDEIFYGYDELNRLTGEARESISVDATGTSYAVYRDIVDDSDLDMTGATAMTIECWFRSDDIDNNTDAYLFKMNQYGSHGNIRCKANKEFFASITTDHNTQTGYPISLAGEFPDDGEWHHAALSWGGGTLRLFLDGALKGSTSTQGSLISTDTQENFFTLAGGNGYKPMDGEIDEVRVSSVARYTSDFTPATHFSPDGNTILLWHLNEPKNGSTAVTAADSSGNGFDGLIPGANTREYRTEWENLYGYDSIGNRQSLTNMYGTESSTVQYTYGYNGLGQLTSVDWPLVATNRLEYSYDANGNQSQKLERSGSSGNWTTDYTWTYEWDVQDRMTLASEYDESASAYDTWVEYVYCPSCGGAMTERIEYSDAGTTVSSWLRYQYEGLNLLRIDERYDGSDAGTAINEGDPWRPVNVFVHAPGQIGQIVKCSIYDGGWVEDIYYHYDALGNVMGYTDSNANATTYEMDAFGNRITNSSYWESMTSIGPKEHLTGKMLDDETGLYYFHARWYDPQVGRFVGRDVTSDPFPGNYLFCLNAPTTFVDPNGETAISPPDIPDNEDEYVSPVLLTMPVGDYESCPDGFVEIWHCKRKLAGKIKLGPLHHAYICCDKAHGNTCFGLQTDNKKGEGVTVEEDKTGRCRKYCVDKCRKDDCCNSPISPKDYDFFNYNCQDWANGCITL